MKFAAFTEKNGEESLVQKNVFVESANTEPMAGNEWNQYQVSLVNGM